MRNRIWLLPIVGSIVWLLVSYAQETMRPVTQDNLQYDNQEPFQLFDRPHKQQGLDTLLARGRVKPEELLASSRDWRRCSRGAGLNPRSCLRKKAAARIRLLSASGPSSATN